MSKGKSKHRAVTIAAIGLVSTFSSACAQPTPQNKEVSLPPWQQELHAAIANRVKEPDKAVAHYREAVKDAAAANVPIEKQLSIIYQCGNLLLEHWRAPEAKELYLQGADIAHKNELKNWEARFLLMTSCAAHTEFQIGLTTKNDPAPVFKALELRPDKPNSQTDFHINCLQAIGNAYIDQNDYSKAEKFLFDALAGVQQLPNQQFRTGEIIRSVLQMLVRQKKFDDALKLLADSCESEPDEARENKNYYVDEISRFDPETAPINSRVHNLIGKKDFAGLDACANELRKSNIVAANGLTQMDYFMDVFNPASYLPEEKWRDRIDFVSNWIKARPDSDTAKTAYAAVLTAYAWKARGSGWADSVTQDGWKLFGERLAKAYDTLAQVKVRTPEWYSVSQRVALGQSRDATQYERLVAECRTRFPKYIGAIFKKAYWLQPKWHGRDGEAVAYINSEANKLPGTAGDALYAQIVWSLDFSFVNVIKDANLDWARTKLGFREILKQHTDSLRARGEFLYLAQQMEDKQTLLSLLPPKANVDERIKLNPPGYAAALSRGQDYQEKDNRALAIHEFSQAITLAPKNGEPYFRRCEMYVMTNKFEQAQADIDKCLAMFPEFAAALSERGRLENVLEKYPESTADLEHALALQPKDASALSTLGHNYDALGNHQRALDTANFALETTEQSDIQNLFYGYQDRGLVWSNAHQYDNAADDLRKGIALNEQHSSQLWAYLAYVDAATDKIAQAKNDAVKLLKLESYLPRGYRLRAEMYRAAGLWAESIPDYNQSTRAEPTYGPGFWQKAISELALGDYKSAEADLNQSVKLVPTSALAYSYLALAEELQGKPEESKTHIEKAFSLTSDLPINYVNRARIELHKGELKKAASDSATALKLDDRLADAYATAAQILTKVGKDKDAETFKEAAKTQWWHEWKVPIECSAKVEAEDVQIELPKPGELVPKPFAVPLRDCAP